MGITHFLLNRVAFRIQNILKPHSKVCTLAVQECVHVSASGPHTFKTKNWVKNGYPEFMKNH